MNEKANIWKIWNSKYFLLALWYNQCSADYSDQKFLKLQSSEWVYSHLKQSFKSNKFYFLVNRKTESKDKTLLPKYSNC